MTAYSNKELKSLTKHLMVMLNDPQVTMATVPKKDGVPELAVLKKEIFNDLVTENQQLRKWAFNMCQTIASDLTLISPNLGETIRVLMLMTVDAGSRFFGMDDDLAKVMKPEGDSKEVTHVGE